MKEVTGEIIRYPFWQYEKSIMNSYEEKNKKELANMLMRCSPSKMNRYEINTEGCGTDCLCVVMDEWITLFENNICTNFLIFFKNNIEQFEYFFDGINFDAKKYDELLTIVNDMM